MKQYLLPENGRFYKANLHCHSTFSDGDWTVEKLKEEYQKRGYSVIAYSDHDRCISHNELTDNDFLALTAYEADVSDWVVKDSNFRRCYHFNCFARDKFADGREVKPLPDYRDLDAVNAFIAKLNDAGFLVAYNHPNWSLQTLDDYGGLKGLFACEVYNHSAMMDGIDANQEQPYDALLRRGNRLFCLATDDNHDRFPPEHPLCDSFGGFVMIKAPKLDYETIFAALEHGDFYASMGPEIHSLTFEDGMLHVETSEVRSIHMTTNARRAEVLHAEHGKTIHEATFHVLPSDGYIRLQIIDREGMRANSNAYFTDTLFA